MSYLRNSLNALIAGVLTCCTANIQAAEQPITVDEDGMTHVPAYVLPPSTYASPESTELLKLKTNKQRAVAYFDSILERAKAVYPVVIEEQRIAGVRTDVITPKAGVSKKNRKRVLINLHGGAFFCRPTAQLIESIPIAATANIKVVSIDYRCAPDHKFPAASEDVGFVYKELLKSYRPENIGIYGCSAGGLLTMEVLAWFRKEKIPMPGAAGSFCAADHILAGDSRWMAPEAGVTPPPPSPNPPDLPELYFSNVDVKDPLVSPTLYPEQLTGYPPLLLIAATRDRWTSSVLHAHRQLIKAGVDAQLHVWEGMPHCFFYAIDLPESKDAFATTARFFDQQLGKRRK